MVHGPVSVRPDLPFPADRGRGLSLTFMGQPITVAVRPGGRPEVRFFETNRSLTGMAIESYTSGEEASGDRPPDVLARRLFERGGIESIHIYSNVVTIKLEPGASADGLTDIMEKLYIHYLPGVEPAKFD